MFGIDTLLLGPAPKAYQIAENLILDTIEALVLNTIYRAILVTQPHEASGFAGATEPQAARRDRMNRHCNSRSIYILERFFRGPIE